MADIEGKTTTEQTATAQVPIELEKKLNGGTAPHQAPDPFNPAAFRINQSFLQSAGIKRILNNVPVRKPHRHDFIRCHPDPTFRVGPIALIELDRDFYILAPNVETELRESGRFIHFYATLRTTITRQKLLFLWPLRLPSDDGKKPLAWHTTAIEAAETAEKRWVQVSGNMQRGAYDLFEAVGVMAEPEWPSESFADIFKIAVKDIMISGFDHAVINQLLGRN
jgi:hypothetical protein